MILFFYGSNSFAARRQIAQLISQYEQKSGSTFGLERIDGAKATLATLRAALQAAPFLANSRLVIIEGLSINKAVTPKIGDLLRDVPSSTVAVFYDPSVDQRTTYFKTMSAAGKTVEFKPLSSSQLQKWVQQATAQLGATIERPALGRLIEVAGEDQWRLSNELAKLANYSQTITVDIVEEMVERNHTDTVFDLIEALSAGRRQQALKYYNNLRQDGQNEIYILSMIIWQLRNLLYAKTAGKITPPELAKKAGMSPFVASKMLSKRHLFQEEQLKTAFLQAVDTDYQIKTGGGDPHVLVEQLIMRIASAVNPVQGA